ncbi:hypothetical protein KQI84_15980 [bacterium]|nr:hypothetical protein [bacterium]
MARKRKQRSTTPEQAASPPPSPTQTTDSEKRSRRSRRSGRGEPVGLVAEWRMWKTLASELRQNWVIIVVPLAIALLLRLIKLGNSDLWIDEIMVYYDALHGTFESVSRAHRVHLGAVGWILNHLSDSPFGLRLWGALLGGFAAGAMGIAGTWFAGRRNGLIWGVLAALNPYLIFYSQDGNYYGPMSFFAATQLMLYIAFFRGAPLGSLLGIVIVGGISFFNHPFGALMTVVALGGCLLGSLIYGKIRREMYSINPKDWLQRPGLIVLFLIPFVLGPKLAKAFVASYAKLTSIIDLGSGLRQVEFSFRFFRDAYTSFGVTHFHPGNMAHFLAYVVFAMAVGGMVWMIVRCRKTIPYLPVAGLMLLTPVISYLVVLNIDAPILFRLRYFTFHSPLFLGAVGFFCFAVGEVLGGKEQKRTVAVSYAALAVVCLIWLPYLGKWYFTDRSNFRSLSEQLAEQRSPSDNIYIPLYHDVAQAEYYFPLMDPPIDLGAIRETHALSQASRLAKSYLLYQLYGEKTAWVISAWREVPTPALWNFMEKAVPTPYRGHSATYKFGDARLYKWTYGDRALLPHTAAEFEVGDKDAPLLVAEAGTWRITNAQGGETPEDLSVRVEGAETEFDDAGNLILTSRGVLQTTIAASGKARLIAAPVYDEDVEIPATDSVIYVEDERISERKAKGGIPTVRRPFDGQYSYVLWVDPDEERQLVLRPVQRSKKYEESARKNSSQCSSGELWLEVACDGKHMGMWRVPVAEEESVISVPTGITLPPGNHLINVYGFTPRLGYSPYNYWNWAGLEWNENGQPAVPSLEEAGAPFVVFPRAVYDWGPAGAEQLPANYGEAGAGYFRKVSDSVVGPSGRPALVVDLEEKATQKEAYHTIFTQPMPVQPGQLLAFSTWLWVDGTTTHDAMLATLFFDSNGQMISRQLGSQQKMTGKLSLGWRRFVEVVPVPQNAALAAPAVMVFPPDPKKAELVGKVYFDAICSLQDGPAVERIPNLEDSLFFDVDGE